MRLAVALAAVVASTAHAEAAHPVAARPDAAHTDAFTCHGNALVTEEEGAIVNVEWPVRAADSVTGRVVSNQTLVTEYKVTLRPDASVAKVSASASAIGGKPAAKDSDVPAGAVYWSDRLPSTLEQVVLRAKALGGQVAMVAISSPDKNVPHEARVERLDANDWTVQLGPTRRYDVVTTADGCLVGASLPDYGIVIERRELASKDVPVVAAYDAPPGAPYTATEVQIPTKAGHVLTGTLTLPKGVAHAPAVVMITGISKHERNEGNPPFTPFRDIADSLGRAGIAVLRVDDRGVGKSTGNFETATSFDEADDVRTELAWLKHQAKIDPKRVGLVGHSEGGFIAPVVASTDPSLAAVVILAGSGVPGEELNTWQTEETVRLDPSVPADKKAEETKKLLADRSDWSPRDTAFVAADPIDFARKVKSPTLIVQGGSDRHVPPRSAERIAAAMRSNGNPDVSVRLIPHLSHTLAPDPVGSIQAWSWMPSRRLSQQLLSDVTDWLRIRLKVVRAPAGR